MTADNEEVEAALEAPPAADSTDDVAEDDGAPWSPIVWSDGFVVADYVLDERSLNAIQALLNEPHLLTPAHGQTFAEFNLRRDDPAKSSIDLSQRVERLERGQRAQNVVTNLLLATSSARVTNISPHPEPVLTAEAVARAAVERLAADLAPVIEKIREAAGNPICALGWYTLARRTIADLCRSIEDAPIQATQVDALTLIRDAITWSHAPDLDARGADALDAAVRVATATEVGIADFLRVRRTLQSGGFQLSPLPRAES